MKIQKGTNVCIWKIEKNLDEILPLLREKHFRTIPELEPFFISDEEKKYLYKWISVSYDSNFTKSNMVISNSNIEYIETIAYLERPSMATNKFILTDTGQPLPKHMRVYPCTSKVIFVNRDNYSYCIVCGSKSIEGSIRSNLMQSRKKDSKWGSIIFSNLPEFKFDKSFYYWLLSNKSKKLEIDEKSILFEDVIGFKSNTERDAHLFEGEGSNIDDEIPLKSIVCMDENLISLYIRLLYDKNIYSFCLDYDGRLSVAFSECGEFATLSPKIIPEVEILLTIYFDIIPFLIEGFNKAKSSDWNEIEDKFRSKNALDVIKRVVSKTGLSIEEISELFK